MAYSLPPPTAAGMREALAGGKWALGADKEAAQALEAEFPAVAGLPLAAWEFHRRAALWAVTEDRDALPARAVVFASAGRHELHAAAAAAAPAARYCYCDADPKTALLHRAVLALPSGGRVTAAEADEEDPARFLAAVAATGIDVSVPVSVHILFAAARWPSPVAREVLAGYGELLAPGSSVCLSLGSAAPGPEGDRLIAALPVSTGRVYRHSREDVAAWFGDETGLLLHPAGVTDARTFGKPAWARDGFEAASPVVRMLEAVGVVPGFSRRLPAGRRSRTR
jgi:hypothetical protein